MHVPAFYFLTFMEMTLGILWQFFYFMIYQTFTVEPLLWDTSILGTPPFWVHKIWSRKNVHIFFVSVTSIEGTPIFSGKGHIFGVPKPGFNLHYGDTFMTQNVLTPKMFDIKCTTIKFDMAIKSRELPQQVQQFV